MSHNQVTSVWRIKERNALKQLLLSPRGPMSLVFRGTWAAFCFFSLSKWFYRAAKLENDGDGRWAALPTWPGNASWEVALRCEWWERGSTAKMWSRSFWGQKPQCGRRPQASPTLVSPVGQGATRGLETRGGGKQKGDGDEGACRAIQGDVDWTERMHGGQPLLERFVPRNAGVAWEENSGCCGAQTAEGSSEPSLKRMQQLSQGLT